MALPVKGGKFTLKLLKLKIKIRKWISRKTLFREKQLDNQN